MIINIKEALHKESHRLLSCKEDSLLKQLEDIKDALLSESKSTAGDKHQTTRAMMQLELEKLSFQLKNLEKQQKLLSKIDPNQLHKNVVLGSCVRTTTMNYYISLSLGEIKLNQESFYAISSQTPIAKLLMLKGVGDTFTFRGKLIQITEVF